MLPWVYGFTWQTGNIIFLSIFYSVVAVILGSFSIAAIRAFRDLKPDRLDEIRWHFDFESLPEFAKVCRHAFTGEVNQRVCRNGFDCRTCKVHSKITGVPRITKSVYSEGEIPFGLKISANCLYHRGHTWVRVESDGTLTLGLDKLAEGLVWSQCEADLPAVGTRLHVNGTGWYFRKEASRARVLSPVDGEVIAVGGRKEGFYLKVNPGNDSDLRHLLKGLEVGPWMTSEVERLEIALGASDGAVSLADGGVLLENIASDYPEQGWEDILALMLLES